MTSENAQNQRTSLPMLRSQGSSVGQEFSPRANFSPCSPSNQKVFTLAGLLPFQPASYIRNPGLFLLLDGTKFSCTGFRSSCGQTALSEQLTSALLWSETRRRGPSQVKRESLGCDIGLTTIKLGNETPGRCVFIAL